MHCLLFLEKVPPQRYEMGEATKREIVVGFVFLDDGAIDFAIWPDRYISFHQKV